MPNPTPGQVNYHAYCTAIYGQHAQVGDYHDLTWGQQHAWEAAAQAVLRQAQTRTLALDPDVMVDQEETPHA